MYDVPWMSIRHHPGHSALKPPRRTGLFPQHLYRKASPPKTSAMVSHNAYPVYPVGLHRATSRHVLLRSVDPQPLVTGSPRGAFTLSHQEPSVPFRASSPTSGDPHIPGNSWVDSGHRMTQMATAKMCEFFMYISPPSRCPSPKSFSISSSISSTKKDTFSLSSSFLRTIHPHSRVWYS